MKTEAEILQIVDEVIAQGPYKADWGSLMTSAVPGWFRQGRSVAYRLCWIGHQGSH